MPASEKQRVPEYLREARMAAGFSSRGIAATEVPYSPETIGRHERGEVPIAPEDAVIYAKGYDRPDILIRYCTDCPIGRATGKTSTDRDLPWAALRVTQRLRKAKEIADTLESIADDGKVDHEERLDFEKALAFLQTLEETITDIVLWATSQGIEKGRPAGTEATTAKLTYYHSITTTLACQSQTEKEERK